MPYPKNIHPLQRQPHPSRADKNWAVQPYKPKPLRGMPRLMSDDYWAPDIVRFKGRTTEWHVITVNDHIISLGRRDTRDQWVRKTIRRHEQHKLEIVYQPPRSHDTTYSKRLAQIAQYGEHLNDVHGRMTAARPGAKK